MSASHDANQLMNQSISTDLQIISRGYQSTGPSNLVASPEGCGDQDQCHTLLHSRPRYAPVYMLKSSLNIFQFARVHIFTPDPCVHLHANPLPSAHPSFVLQSLFPSSSFLIVSDENERYLRKAKGRGNRGPPGPERAGTQTKWNSTQLTAPTGHLRIGGHEATPPPLLYNIL